MRASRCFPFGAEDGARAQAAWSRDCPGKGGASGTVVRRRADVREPTDPARPSTGTPPSFGITVTSWPSTRSPADILISTQSWIGRSALRRSADAVVPSRPIERGRVTAAASAGQTTAPRAAPGFDHGERSARVGRAKEYIAAATPAQGVLSASCRSSDRRIPFARLPAIGHDKPVDYMYF